MVIDAFLFRNELDMLELRLHELSEVVDWFILVEAGMTYSGRPKELVFPAHRHDPRFAPFLDRLVHVVVDDLPGDYTWTRAWYQRNQMRRGLECIENLSDDDLLLVSDLDEIPRAECVARVRDDPALRATQCAFEQTFYQYHPRCWNMRTWYGTRSIPIGALNTTQELREVYEVRAGETAIPNAGWHFSYFMDIEAIQEKARSLAETRYNVPQFMDTENIRRAMRECRFFAWERNWQRYQQVELHDLPAFMMAHLDRWDV